MLLKAGEFRLYNKGMKFTRIILYATGVPCSRNTSRYDGLTQYILRHYRNNLGIYQTRRTETNKAWVDKLKAHGINPSQLAVEYETEDGETGLVYYRTFMSMIE